MDNQNPLKIKQNLKEQQKHKLLIKQKLFTQVNIFNLNYLDFNHIDQLQTLIFKQCIFQLNAPLTIKSIKQLKKICFNNSNVKQVTIIALIKMEFLKLQACLNIKTIYVQNCPLLTKVELLNCNIISQMIQQLLNQAFSLQKLIIKKCDTISSLILTQNKNLKVLFISQSSIAFLQVNLFSSLKQLFLQNCISLKKLKIIQCLQFKRKHIKTSQIEQIQFRKVPIKKLNLNCYYSLNKIFLQNCQNLQDINVHNTNTKQVNLIQLQRLTKINLSQCYSLKKVCIQKCDKIQTILLQHTPINDQFLQNMIKNLSSVVYLNLHHCQKLKLFRIKGLNKLKRLNLQSTVIQDNVLCQLFQYLPNLECLNLYCSFPIQNLQLSNLSNLKSLDFDLTYVRFINFFNLGLQSLNLCHKHLELIKIKQCKKLKSIRIIKCKKIDYFEISKLDALQYIHLIGTKLISSIDLNMFSNLKTIYFQHCVANLLDLSKLSFLQSLKILYSTIKGGIKLGKSELLQILYIKNIQIQQLHYLKFIEHKKQKEQHDHEQQYEINPKNIYQCINKQGRQVQKFQKQQSKKQPQINIQRPFVSVLKQKRIIQISKLYFSQFFDNLTILNLGQNFIDNIQMIGLFKNQKLKQLNLSMNYITNYKKCLNRINRLRFLHLLSLKNNKYPCPFKTKRRPRSLFDYDITLKIERNESWNISFQTILSVAVNNNILRKMNINRENHFNFSQEFNQISI